MERLVPLPLVNPVSKITIFQLEDRVKALEGFILDTYISDHYKAEAEKVLKYESIEDIIEHVVTSKMEIQLRHGAISLAVKHD